MIHFKIDDTMVDMPSLWEEVDVATFQRIAALDSDYTDIMALIGALVNMTRDQVSNSDALGTMQLTAALKLVADQQPLWDKIPFRDQFQFRGESFEVPKNLEFERFGQKALLQIKLTESDPSQCIAYAIAIYLQPLIDDSTTFDDKRVPELEAEILKLPVVECYPIAYFFFEKLKQYKILIISGFNPFQ